MQKSQEKSYSLALCFIIDIAHFIEKEPVVLCGRSCAPIVM